MFGFGSCQPHIVYGTTVPGPWNGQHITRCDAPSWWLVLCLVYLQNIIKTSLQRYVVVTMYVLRSPVRTSASLSDRSQRASSIAVSKRCQKPRLITCSCLSDPQDHSLLLQLRASGRFTVSSAGDHQHTLHWRVGCNMDISTCGTSFLVSTLMHQELLHPRHAAHQGCQQNWSGVLT